MDALTIGSALSSLKAAGDIAKTIIGLRDEVAVQGKVIELQKVILDVQSSALQWQSHQNDLLHKNRDLEAENSRLKAELSAKSKAPIPEARRCPLCQSEMKVLSEQPHPHFDFAGRKIHKMECTSCQNKVERDYDPKKGYS